MRSLPMAFLAASALALSACGGSAEEANEAAQEVDSNIMFGQPGNDSSALEAAGAEPLAPPPASEEMSTGNASGNALSSAPPAEPLEGSAPIHGESQGGDTGGNVAQGNSTGQ